VASVVLALTSMTATAAPPDGEIDEPAQPGTLKLVTTAVSIVVRVIPLDRELAPIELGVPPIAAELPAGRYRVEVEGPGYRDWARDVELRPGEDLELQAEPELISGARLELRASDEASEGASVSLDGAKLCELPCREDIEPGLHQVEIRKRRHKRLAFPVEVTQADEVVIDVTLERATSRAPAVITGAFTVTSLAVAIAFTVRSDQTRRSLAADLDALEQYDADDRRIDNGRRDAVIAASMYGVTAAVGLLTLYYLLRQPGPRSRAEKRQRNLARWQLVPALGPTGGGVLGRVEF
jgi:hypothetical protein